MIQVECVSKSFRVARRNAGWKEAVKSLWHREYEIVQALSQISFVIPDGEMVGYIGPNGAGKSSTIKILSGILTPEEGNVTINGRTPWKQRKEHVREIGVVFGQRTQLWWDVPVIDSFYLLKDIYSRKIISGKSGGADRAYEFVRDCSDSGKTIIFGTTHAL